MLKPAECFVASLGKAEPMSFVIPTASFAHRALVFEADDRKLALFVDGPEDFRFHFLLCEDRWSGLHIPGVSIELDPASIFDTNGQWAPLGSLTRHGENLVVQSRFLDGRAGPFGTSLEMMTGLPVGETHSKACFLRWQIVLGEGDEKRVLHTVNASPVQR